MKSYRYSPSSRFRPRRPIRSFRDLGIYQTTEQISVEIMRKLVTAIPAESLLKKELAEFCMKIPHYIAEAHSRRFDDKPKAMKLLEEVLFLCNKVVVYLEQVRDIYGTQNSLDPGQPSSRDGINPVVCNELINKYFLVRQKIFNFYKAWKKFEKEDAASS